MDDLHELREMLTICADELQEVAKDDKKTVWVSSSS